MTYTASCATCPAVFTRPTIQAASDALWTHDSTDHRGEPAAPVTQLPTVTFHEQALLAILALARTGQPFTVGHAHPMVDAQPLNPSTDWETARREAQRLGWIEWTGEYTDSKVPTSKRSAVKVWRGTYASRRNVA